MANTHRCAKPSALWLAGPEALEFEECLRSVQAMWEHMSDPSRSRAPSDSMHIPSATITRHQGTSKSLVFLLSHKLWVCSCPL